MEGARVRHGPADRWLCWLAGALLCTLGTTARAQVQGSAYPELRVDGMVGRGSTIQAGAGEELPLGYYVRLGLIGAAGVTRRDGVTTHGERVDLVARYLLDPFRETPDALSLGGGMSFVAEPGKRLRPYLVVVADIEGRRRGSWSPALQIGLGGGARIGVVLRRSRGQSR